MDGTLVDSITAVEAAWSSVANELGMPADEVIAATHGRRAIDNLRDLKPKLRRLTNEQMDEHVQEVSLSCPIPSLDEASPNFRWFPPFFSKSCFELVDTHFYSI
jgi:beta-phosphoglucomutase-like phosphatase (HAD superfamily)